jgi:hypothetical protein
MFSEFQGVFPTGSPRFSGLMRFSYDIFGVGVGGISVSAVMAAIGSALTAGYLEERQVTKRLRP